MAKHLSQELIKTLSDEITRLVIGGKPIEVAIKIVWKKYGIPEAMRETARIAASKIVAQNLGMSSVRAAGSSAKAWDALIGSDKEASKQLANASANARQSLEIEIKSVIKKGEAVRAAAVRMETQAPGSLVALRKEIKTIKSAGLSSKEIDTLRRKVTSGIKGKELKSAYRGVLDAVESGLPDRIEKQMNIAIMQKTRYNLERVVITEKNRAHFASQREKIAADEDVEFVKFILAGGHELDECDAYASADMGYGPGVYPIDQAPKLPIHPNGKSKLVPVYAPKRSDKKITKASEALANKAGSLGVKLNGIKLEPIVRKI